MDIEINAAGRVVKITDIECEMAEDCIDAALKLWEAIAPPEGITHGSSFSTTERSTIQTGFADLTGDRLDVR